MNIIKRLILKIRHYHAALGLKGVFLFLYSKVTGHKPVVNVKVEGISHPVRLRIGTTDVATYRQVLVSRQYDFDEPDNAQFIIDAGANIGLSAVFFANRFPKAKIVAIEPEDSNYRMLCENAAPYPGIRPVRAALWRENEDLFLFDKGHGNHGFQISEDSKEDGSRVGAVLGLTVDAIMRESGVEKVDLLKIDIEGAEREVFEACSDWISKVGVLMVELHDEIKPGCEAAFRKATGGFTAAEERGETIMCQLVSEDRLIPA